MEGTPALGSPATRREAALKVTGAARYAADHTPPGCLYAWPVAATVAVGRVVRVDTAAAAALPGVTAVLTAADAPRLGPTEDAELRLLQDDRVPHHGWYVALAVADTPERARAAADAVSVTYDTGGAAPDVRLHEGHPGGYEPEQVNGGYPARREQGDALAAYQDAPVRLDLRYAVPPLHNHPMEPHAATAVWDADGERLTVYDSSQGAGLVRTVLASLFGLAEERVTVHSEHVGGGFGCKGTPRPHVVLAVMAARHTGRPVKLALPRAHLPAVVGHRAPTLHRVRLGARPDGTLTALAHEVTTHTSRIREFVEQAAVPARVMYAAPGLLTAHRVVPLDVPTPSWMRAPGETPGMYALESAMDELADAVGVDPVELRVRNEPSAEPDSGRPYSSRGLVACLREGARRFGWPGTRGPRTRDGLLTGAGVAASTYPVYLAPCQAVAHALPDGTYRVEVAATDIGTGARTVLAMVAADALGVPADRVTSVVGHSDLPPASVAGGSSGTGSWGWAVHEACRALALKLARRDGKVPEDGLCASADTTAAVKQRSPYARHAFGAQFAEVSVDPVSGEVRVLRMLGVFAAGRILNPLTARSQFVGGMVMGLGMALTEHSPLDPARGDFTARDLASYHVPVHADVPDIEAHWVDEHDKHLDPMGSKGIGEIGTVGAAAAIGNAFARATGRRIRELPLTPDRVLAALAAGEGPGGT
ncbi:xanthine dehydrogenase family protein molybdopterin-binding subunit [Streptomyces lavendulae]|uniref:xanthine dehydrogenase family protein molybdopterin-binding subunit n=1 Tax=Streptomyces lavendulae TaxID=1914 RepID=UPI0024A60482|nr:xanthine dehydrogenase family protein molybdopterin-binding subunit [Streptomyces lavendulae]GLX21617.1 oxidoreductase [Streptomyces lavendulae subsp. lavendulae]GLX29034.1 oxidoreductase [Streptomyces lavendulae subsp. lavendulae]